MAGEQLGQKLLVDRDFAPLERGELVGIVVHQDNFVAEIGEADPCDQAHVSRTDDSNAHIPSKTPLTVSVFHRSKRHLAGGDWVLSTG